MHGKTSRNLRLAIISNLFRFAGIVFCFPAFAGGLLPGRINQIIIQGHFNEKQPAFLVIFSSAAEHSTSDTPAAPSGKEGAAAKQTVAIKLYGKPATKPGRFDYFFGTLYDGGRPWNNGADFHWQDWEKVSPDIWDNIRIIYLPPETHSGEKSPGLINNVTVRRNSMLLYDSRVRQSYPNKKPIDVSFQPVDLGLENKQPRLLNLAEYMAKFRNEFYELGDQAILGSAYADLGQTEKDKYTNRGRNWCSEFAAYIYRQNGYPAPDPNKGDVYWKNMRTFFERHGKIYPLREVSAWSDTDKITKIKPGSFVSILIGQSTHSLLFTTWIVNGKNPLTQYTAVSGNNKGMVWSHAPLSLPTKQQFQDMTQEQLAEYDQKVFFGVMGDQEQKAGLAAFPAAYAGKPLRGWQ